VVDARTRMKRYAPTAFENLQTLSTNAG